MIAKNLSRIQKEIPSHVTLVAVSKTKPTQDIQEAYDAGQRIFGENKVQEMVHKYQQLPQDISWHMIGHLQRNKVKYMASFVTLIHGVDSIKLLQEINKQGALVDRQLSVLLQVHIAEESSKFGFEEQELKILLEMDFAHQFPHVKIQGLMGMATFTDNQNQIRKEFKNLKRLYDRYKDVTGNWSTLSMGMSSDYQIAIEEGSNMVRIGSSIFGTRNYSH